MARKASAGGHFIKEEMMTGTITKLAGWLALAASFALAPVAQADTANGSKLIGTPWPDIVTMARGGTVNWFLWGGDDNINQYVSGYIGGLLKSRYNITLNRVGVSDTVDAVNIVLGEVQSGVTSKGSVDLIWINGENFRTMRQGNLLFCGYVKTLPNNRLVDWNNLTIANDFGVPVNGCEVPWSRAQFAFAYDSAVTKNPPESIPALIKWIKAHPGEFTYPAPPDFNGSVFVRHIFYYAAGGVDNLLGKFDQAKYDVAAKKTWKILNDLKPYLWRKGRTYPVSITAMQQLFANREISLFFNYEPSRFGTLVENGTFPPSVRSYGLSDGTIGNTNYTAIPINSPNKAAAMVLQNLLLSGAAQYEKARPDVWGTAPAIDISRTSAAIQAKFASIKLPASVVSMEELAKHSLPELQASWISAIEKGWQKNVASK